MEKEDKISAEDKSKFIALQKNLFDNEFVKNIALSNSDELTERYGSFGKDALEGIYMSTASKAPNQEAYEALFGEAVLGEGVLGKEQLRKNAMKVWGSSMAYQNTQDLAKRMGYSGELDSKYAGKMVGELDKQSMAMIVSGYKSYEVSNLMRMGLEAEQAGIAQGLEKILAPQKPKEESDK